jgi:carbonic anhydrase/acetyltransferase-like protein (isoleucine patch superfamily)
MALLKAYLGKKPVVSPDVAFLAENAALIGDVHLDRDVSVWYGAVLRADSGSMEIGAATNIQDNAVLHTGSKWPLKIGAGVTVGHSALVHGCTVGDGCLIGMHATILNGAVIGEGSVIAAGALITEGTVIPPRSLVMGVPGKVRGPVSPELAAKLPADNAHYVRTAREHAAESALSYTDT